MAGLFSCKTKQTVSSQVPIVMECIVSCHAAGVIAWWQTDGKEIMGFTDEHLSHSDASKIAYTSFSCVTVVI